MPNRAAIQDAHEIAVLRAALTEHNRLHGLTLELLSRPDPPDAILSDGKTTTWLELTDAFFSPEWARDLSSYAASEKHIPMRSGPYMDMDALLAAKVCELICRKAAKSSYKPFISKYGPGILVVGLESPWLDDETLCEITRKWAGLGNPNISGTFSQVYLGYRDREGNKVMAWPHT
ncbi:MAG: hypothetical protein WA159_14530 [Variovorax sp.]